MRKRHTSTNGHRSGAESPAERRRPQSYPPEVRQKAVELLLRGMKRRDVAREIGCCGETIRLWVKEAKKKLAADLRSNGKGQREAPTPETSSSTPRDASCVKPELSSKQPRSPSTAPKDPGSGLSAFEAQAIVDLKKRYPSMQPPQIRAQLKRFKGWRLGLRPIARVLRENGYELEHRKGRPQEPQPPTRWEAPRRNALWQADFTEVRLPDGPRALGVVVDDFSRFVVNFGLFRSPTSEDVVAMFREAIRLHGRPEAVYTDRAGPFTAWGKAESFQKFLAEELINHHLTPAYRPQGRGKVEAVIKTVKRELWEVEYFATEAEALDALNRFFARYNHRRAHLGLDGLTPADRFFGRWETVLAAVQAESRKRQGVEALKEKVHLTEEPSPPDRTEVMRIVASDGELELRFFGHCVRLGRIVS